MNHTLELQEGDSVTLIGPIKDFGFAVVELDPIKGFEFDHSEADDETWPGAE